MSEPQPLFELAALLTGPCSRIYPLGEVTLRIEHNPDTDECSALVRIGPHEWRERFKGPPTLSLVEKHLGHAIFSAWLHNR